MSPTERRIRAALQKHHFSVEDLSGIVDFIDMMNLVKAARA